MAVNGKAKGSAGGRLIAKILSQWLGSEGKEVWIWRSPNSGGMSTTHNIQSGSGDLVAIDPRGEILLGKYSLEIKTGYSDTSIDNCLKTNKNENLRDFWIQCNDDANKGNKLPILIYNKKGAVTKNMWIGFDDRAIKRMKKLKTIPKVTVEFDNKYDIPNLHLFNFGLFLETISPKDL